MSSQGQLDVATASGGVDRPLSDLYLCWPGVPGSTPSYSLKPIPGVPIITLDWPGKIIFAEIAPAHARTRGSTDISISISMESLRREYLFDLKRILRRSADGRLSLNS